MTKCHGSCLYVALVAVCTRRTKPLCGLDGGNRLVSGNVRKHTDGDADSSYHEIV
jgi:hypothetical protein